MRSFFREVFCIFSATTLIFFCSCERHHPDELAFEEHAKAEPAKHKDDAHGKKRERAAEQPHTSPSPTPAQFFPESTPH
jgi:hypothetical protein